MNETYNAKRDLIKQSIGNNETKKEVLRKRYQDLKREVSPTEVIYVKETSWLDALLSTRGLFLILNLICIILVLAWVYLSPPPIPNAS